MHDYYADSDKFGDEAASPLVEAFHSAVKDLVRQRFAASGKQWADFVFDDAFLRKWQTYLPQAKVHRLADAGHYVLEDAAEEVIPLISDFIRA